MLGKSSSSPSLYDKYCEAKKRATRQTCPNFANIDTELEAWD